MKNINVIMVFKNGALLEIIEESTFFDRHFYQNLIDIEDGRTLLSEIGLSTICNFRFKRRDKATEDDIFSMFEDKDKKKEESIYTFKRFFMKVEVARLKYIAEHTEFDE